MRKGWQLKSLGAVADFKGGGTPSTEVPGYWNGEIPWVSPKDMKTDQIGSSIDRITLEAVKNSAASIIPTGSILIVVRSGILARKIPTAITTHELTVNQDIKALCPHSGLDGKYLHYFLRSAEKHILSLVTTGATVHRLMTENIKSLQLPLPPLPEQKRIVAILDEAFEGIDTAVANAEKNLANARELFESYLNAALSRADGWVERKIGDSDLLQIIDGDRGTNYPSKEDFFEEGFCVFLNTKNVRPDGFNFDTAMFITEEKDNQLRKGKLKRRDVVLTTRGTIGNIALYDDNVSFDHIRINSGMLIFRPNEKIILSEYLFEMLRSGVVKSQIAQFVSGAAQPQLPIHTLSKFSIPVPKILADQKQIVGRLHALSSESKRLEGIYQQKLEGLAELKQAILHKAFSGGLTATAAKALVEAAE